MRTGTTAKNTNKPIWLSAPVLGTHLPIRSGSREATVATTMKPHPNRYMPDSDRPPMNDWYTDMATTTMDPPSHHGVPAQYSSEVSPPANRPNALRTQT